MYLTSEKIASSFDIIRGKNPDLSQILLFLITRKASNWSPNSDICQLICAAMECFKVLTVSFHICIHEKSESASKPNFCEKCSFVWFFWGGYVLAKIATELFKMKL